MPFEPDPSKRHVLLELSETEVLAQFMTISLQQELGRRKMETEALMSAADLVRELEHRLNVTVHLTPKESS